MDDEMDRLEMVSRQIAGRGLRDPRLLAVFRAVPRHRFVLPRQQPFAYDDTPLPIGWGQTISQPYMVALMTALLHLRGNEVVLEIGTGSGYQAAILAGLARQVYTLERQPELAERAARALVELGIRNVTLLQQDGSGGLPEHAPYQGILVTAAAPTVPPPLLAQLAPGGRLVIPVGPPGGQELQAWEHSPQGFDSAAIAPVMFVPLRGSYGWSEEAWRTPPESIP